MYLYVPTVTGIHRIDSVDYSVYSVLQVPLELRLTQIDSNRFKSAKIDSGRFCSTKLINSKSVEAHIKSVFRIFVSVVFVLQKLPESISTDLKRFEPICVSLNSTGICSTLRRMISNPWDRREYVNEPLYRLYATISLPGIV